VGGRGGAHAEARPLRAAVSVAGAQPPTDDQGQRIWTDRPILASNLDTLTVRTIADNQQSRLS